MELLSPTPPNLPTPRMSSRAGAHLQDGDRDQQRWQGTMRPLGAQLCEDINQAS